MAEEILFEARGSLIYTDMPEINHLTAMPPLLLKVWTENWGQRKLSAKDSIEDLFCWLRSHNFE